MAGRDLRALICAVLVGLMCLSHPEAGAPEPPVSGQTVPPSTVEPPCQDGLGEVLDLLGYGFVENLGQVENSRVRYYVEGNPLSIGVTADGLVLVQNQAIGDGTALTATSRLTFEGAREVEPVGQEPSGRRDNIFIGNDPTRWVHGARTFQEVLLEHVYDGVDVRFYFSGGRFKYDVDLDRGADLADVVMRYEGVDDLCVDSSSGDLFARTAAGLLRDERPVILQGAAREDRYMSDYMLLDAARVAFYLPEGIDPSLPMTVDPGIEFSTLCGGTGTDSASVVKEDSYGRVHVLGWTRSAVLFPEITGLNLTSTVTDIYGLIIPRLGDPNVTAYRIGASGADTPLNLFFAQDDRIFIGGSTYSWDFPIVNPLDDTLNGDDGFVLSLDGNASDILFSTFFGGSHSDYIQGCEADDEGNLYLFGGTLSTDLPCTPGAYCRTLEGSASQGGFVARFTTTPPALDYCTYINGVGYDACFDVMVDADGRMFIAGATSATTSTGFPVTPDAYCRTKHLGDDGYVVVLDPTGSTMEHGTFIGGDSSESCKVLLSTPDGSLLVLGTTSSNGFPTTPGAYSRTLGGITDTFLSVLDENLTSMRMSTFFGGGATDNLCGAILSSVGDELIMSGSTKSIDLPVSEGTFDPLPRGYSDSFIASFDTGTWRPVYCTYIGGSGNDTIASKGVTQSATGTLLVCGNTDSPDFPTTGDAFYSSVRGEIDGFLLALDFAPPTSGPNAPRNLTVTSGDHTTSLSWSSPLFKEAQAIGYWVYRVNTTQGGPLQRIVHLTLAQTAYIDALAINGQDYQYSVSAENSVMEGPRCDPVTAHPLGVPTPPIGLGWETGGGTVNLTWSPPVDDGGQLDGYYVLKGEDVSDIHQRAATLGSGENRWMDTQVSPTLHYYYNIVAFNPVGNSTPGNLADAVPLDRPSRPTNVTAGPHDGYIDISWNPPSTDGGSRITGYRIRWGNAFDSTPHVVMIEPIQFEWRHSGLTNGMLYYYYIEAVNDNGTSDRATPDNFPATPFGPTSAPRDLVADPGDASVLLTWKAPFDENGAPVKYYLVHISTTGPGSFLLRSDPIFERQYNYTGAVNDQAHYFQVTALNDGGESLPSNTVNATPRAIPGQPTSFTAQSVIAGIQLSWTGPDWTSIYTLDYTILRGSSELSLENLTTVSVLTSYLDTTAQVGRTYFYRVVAVNAAGNRGQASDLVWETRATVPGDVSNPHIVAGDKEVELDWSPPSYDGGSEILRYKVLRGYNASALTEVHALQNGSLNWTDIGLINGQEYTYTVLAVNSVGASPVNQTWTVKPLAVSGMVILEPPRYKDGKVRLGWSMPDYPDKLPPTGFIVYKGRLKSSMEPVATLEPSARNWTDGSVEAGGTYYYYIVTDCSRGPGGRTDTVSIRPPPSGAFDWIPILIILIIVIAMAWVALVMGRRRDTVTAGPSKAGADLIVEAGAPIVPTAAGPIGPHHLVEEVFVIYKDGRLIAECSLDTCKTADADLMSGMLIAVQGIVQEGLQKGGELESIKYGDNLIVLKSGAHINIAAIIYGEPDTELTEELEATVERIEVSYSGVIEHWDGDLTPLSGMTEMVKPLFEKTATVTRADVKGPAPAPSVSLLSSIDFHRGYVRLKLAVVNATKESVTDASIEVHYDHDMLRLERVIPVSLEMRGDSIVLGNVRPAERKSVALLLDPQICHGTHIDGTLVYYDPKGELCRVEMKRRRADVVCPIFFTKTHANTAMLRKLIKEKLHNSDVRAFRYPDALASASMLELGRRALAGNAIQMVRQYIREGPPYYAEVWYYGETKVKGHQIVMRLGVIEEKRALEFFAASTDMEPITGLLAEFKRELDRMLEEGHPGKGPMVPLRSEAVLGDIEGRMLLIDERDGPIVE